MSLCKLSAPDGLTGFPAAEHKSHFCFGDGFPRGTGGTSIELVKNIAWPVLVLFLNSYGLHTYWAHREALLSSLYTLTN